MALQAYQTKIQKVQAILWDGTDEAYDAVAPIIGRSIKTYVKRDGADVGTLTIRANAVDLITVNIGQYIVITNADLGAFRIMNDLDFQAKYEPAQGDSGLDGDGDEGGDIIPPVSTAGGHSDSGSYC